MACRDRGDVTSSVLWYVGIELADGRSALKFCLSPLNSLQIAQFELFLLLLLAASNSPPQLPIIYPSVSSQIS